MTETPERVLELVLYRDAEGCEREKGGTYLQSSGCGGWRR